MSIDVSPGIDSIPNLQAAAYRISTDRNHAIVPTYLNPIEEIIRHGLSPELGQEVVERTGPSIHLFEHLAGEQADEGIQRLILGQELAKIADEKSIAGLKARLVQHDAESLWDIHPHVARDVSNPSHITWTEPPQDVQERLSKAGQAKAEWDAFVNGSSSPKNPEVLVAWKYLKEKLPAGTTDAERAKVAFRLMRAVNELVRESGELQRAIGQMGDERLWMGIADAAWIRVKGIPGRNISPVVVAGYAITKLEQKLTAQKPELQPLYEMIMGSKPIVGNQRGRLDMHQTDAADLTRVFQQYGITRMRVATSNSSLGALSIDGQPLMRNDDNYYYRAQITILRTLLGLKAIDQNTLQTLIPPPGPPPGLHEMMFPVPQVA